MVECEDGKEYRCWEELLPDALGLIFRNLPLQEVLTVVPRLGGLPPDQCLRGCPAIRSSRSSETTASTQRAHEGRCCRSRGRTRDGSAARYRHGKGRSSTRQSNRAMAKGGRVERPSRGARPGKPVERGYR
ncbi:uncharacterized protein [Miscanthus floridulus]|uniref:uncharacterized protein n=1 Tax=Miscanthus floridulus TaxID=154761 RepID=UPI003457C128